PTCDRGSASFVAVTTTGSTCLVSCALAGRTKPDPLITTIITTAKRCLTASLLLRRKGGGSPGSGLLTRGSARRPRLPISDTPCVSADSGAAIRGTGRRSPLTVARPCRSRPHGLTGFPQTSGGSHAWCLLSPPPRRGLRPAHLDVRAARQRVVGHDHVAA